MIWYHTDFIPPYPDPLDKKCPTAVYPHFHSLPPRDALQEGMHPLSLWAIEDNMSSMRTFTNIPSDSLQDIALAQARERADTAFSAQDIPPR